MQNKRYRMSLNGLHKNQQNETDMENHEQHQKSDGNSFKMSIINPSQGMPSPSNDPTITYFIHDLKERLNMAIKEIDKWQDRAEANNEKVQEKQREIDDLKRSIEKMEDAKNAKSGMSEMLDGFRDEGGQLDLAGLGQLVKGAGEGFAAVMKKGTGVPSQLTGLETDMPPEIKEYVTHFATWFGGIDSGQRKMAWNIINAMATSPEIGLQFQNIIQNDSSIRKTKAAAH